MIGEYHNKNFILFPLQTKPTLKFCSTCKRLKSLNQFNKYPWKTYFFRTYCEHDKDEKRKALIEKLKQKYMAQGLSKSFIFFKQLIIKKVVSQTE